MRYLKLGARFPINDFFLQLLEQGDGYDIVWRVRVVGRIGGRFSMLHERFVFTLGADRMKVEQSEV